MNKLDKFLSRLDKKTRLIVEQVVLLILENDLSMLDLKKLSGSKDLFRVRVWKIRIIFRHTKAGNKLLKISYRDSNTYSDLGI